MKANLDVFDWSLSRGDMATLNQLSTSPDDPTIRCVLPCFSRRMTIACANISSGVCRA